MVGGGRPLLREILGQPVVCKCCVGAVYELVCELVGSRRIRLY